MWLSYTKTKETLEKTCLQFATRDTANMRKKLLWSAVNKTDHFHIYMQNKQDTKKAQHPEHITPMAKHGGQHHAAGIGTGKLLRH